MSRYSKFNSSYILRKQHQSVDGGIIIERDWTTIGERHNIAQGKRKVSYDGNFLFTENTEQMAYRKAATSRWVGSYNYDDVKDATDTVNKVKLNTTTDDPRFFAYYGSLYTQFEGAIVNIIKFFPGNIRFGTIPFTPLLRDYKFPDNKSEIKNDFEINFISQPKNLTKYDNELRYMSLSWDKYVIVVDGVEKEVVGYSVENKQTSINAIESVYIGNGELFKYDGKYYKYDKSTGQYIDINITESDNYFVKCNEYIKHKDDYYKWSDEENMYKKLPIDKVCNSEVYHMYDVNFCTKLGDGGVCDGDDVYKIGIYRLYDVVVFVNDITDHTIEIRPKKDVIEAYFASLDGLEGIMLNRKMNPNYSFDMTVCETDNMDNVILKKLTLSWPKEYDGYCIKIDGVEFESFTDQILTSAENYDLHYSDNIWRSMTHEAIKNYDWSYERNSEDVDLVDNAIGSNVVCDILRLIGMEFDELKNYIEGITNSNKLTYDGFLNMPDSEVVTALENGGFDTVSTIWHQDEYVEIAQSEIPENVTPNNYFAIPSTSDVLDDYISVGCEGSENGIHYYKRVSTIGDDVRLDYEFFNPEEDTDYQIGKINPWILSNYSGYGYRKMMSLPSYVTDDYWSDRNTYTVPPTVGSRFSPKFARVINGGGYDYYEKISSFDDMTYTHSTWFDRLDPNYFSQSVVDIDVMRRLGLSCRNIFATKGTAHAIDMIMGVFGFGRNDNDSLSDYKLIESYHELDPIGYDDDFWYYEQLEEEPLNVTYPPGATFATLPLNATDNNTIFPVDIRVDDGFGGYYYFRKNKKKAYDVASSIYTAMSLMSYEDAEYPGFPLATTYINGVKCFIPFVGSKNEYHGDIYFQSKGGWCKKSSLNTGIYDWEETVPYIKSVNTPSNLIADDGNYNVGDYVYVKYPLDNNESFIINPAHVSNYFKLVETDYENPLSWRNIPIDGPIMFDNYIPPTDDDEYAPTHQDFVNVKFMDEIIFTNKGNNPHAGQRKYDAGEDYLSYIRLPFKYAVDNPTTSFYSNVSLTLAKQFAFSVSGRKYLSKKAFVHNFPYVYEQMENEPDFGEDYWTSLNTFSSIPSVVYPSSPEFIRILVNNTYSYFRKVKGDDALRKYQINSKVLIMRNLNNNVLYKRYFNQIILPYLLQVIPSTTIFVLENFNECDVENGVYHNVQATAGGDGCGEVSGSGRYFDCDYAVLTATPGENCHFVEWQLVDCDTNTEIPTDMDMTTETIMPKIVGDACYVAIFEYNCTIRVTNGEMRCEHEIYSDDVIYGRIVCGDNIELRPGSECVVDDQIGQFYFTAYPIEGYTLTSWHIFFDGADVTEALIEKGCINISDVGTNFVLFVNDKKCICGCTIAPLFSPNEYTVSADILCPCDDSSVDMSDPQICDPVEIYFSCCKDEDFCCQASEFVYRVNGGGERRKPYDEFDTPVIVERGSRINIRYQSSIGCCKFDRIEVDNTLYDQEYVDFEAINDVHRVCGTLQPTEAKLEAKIICCNKQFSIEAFYSGGRKVTKCQCGDDVRLVCKIPSTCLALNFIINNEVFQGEVQYTQGINPTAFIDITNVSSDIFVEVDVDWGRIPEPDFHAPIGMDPGDDCYEYTCEFPNCTKCTSVCFGFDIKGKNCDYCQCKYEFVGWEIYSGGLWKPLVLSKNCISFANYLSLIEEEGCSAPIVRAVVVKKELCVDIVVNGTYPQNFSVDCTYGQTTENIEPNNKKCFTFVDGQTIIVESSDIGVCGKIKGVSLKGCGTINQLDGYNRFEIYGACGNVTLTYTFQALDLYTISARIYDYETGEPTVHECATINKMSSGVAWFAECGKDSTFTVDIEEDSCCTSVVEILDNGVNIISQMQGNEVTIPNVTSNHEIRVYVSHPIYNITIVYKPNIDCQNQTCDTNTVMNCLQINCLNSISCANDFSSGTRTCQYMCGTSASFSEAHTCCDDLCCNYVFTATDFERGFASEFNFQHKEWNPGSSVITTTNLSNVIFGDIKNDYVIVVRYCCEARSETLEPPTLTVTPIQLKQNTFIPFSPIPNCIDYSHEIVNTHGKLCEIDNILTARSNDCWDFIGWYSFDGTNYTLISTEEEYHYCACESETIYPAFKVASSGKHTITATLEILEQNMQPFNSVMHDNKYTDLYNSISAQTDSFSEECGKDKTFRFHNPHPDYFSMQGLYIDDPFNGGLNPVFDVDVIVTEDGSGEHYEFTVSACGNINYVVVLVPTDYITFYNPEYITDPGKDVVFKMGYYSNYGDGPLVRPDDTSYLPKVTYWNTLNSTWTNIQFNNSSYKFEQVVHNDFFMVRIDTPVINNDKIGNYVILTGSADKSCAKIEVSIPNTNGMFDISGSILSLCYGAFTTTISNLPDYFAKEIFKLNSYTGLNKPGNIFGYAFRLVQDIGKYAMYDMFYSSYNRCSSDFIMFDHVKKIDDYGCYKLFDSSTLIGISVENFIYIGKHGCEYMFNGCNRIENDLNFNKLTFIDDDGCRAMFMSADGQIGPYVQNTYPITVSFPALTQIGTRAFDTMFNGCALMEITLLINGNNVTPLHQSQTYSTFNQAFRNSGIVSADISGVIVPPIFDGTGYYNHGYFRDCFTNANNLSKLKVGCNFVFEREYYNNMYMYNTENWLDGAGNGNATFRCSTACQSSISSTGGPNITTVPSTGWTISTYC